MEPSTVIDSTVDTESSGISSVGVSVGTWTVDSTDMVNVVDPWFPAASVAVQVIIVSPIGKNVPDSGVQTGSPTTASLSAAAGLVYVTSAPFATNASTEMSWIDAKDGAIVSPVAAVLITVILNDVAPIFPTASAAVQVTVVDPTANNEPDTGVHVGPDVTPMLSVAVGI